MLAVQETLALLKKCEEDLRVSKEKEQKFAQLAALFKSL
jgi:hypothetical protein